jgi:methionyl-tRNA formyltransferase
MRLIFMGSPDFAVPSLDRLVTDGHTVGLVATQPDRPAGRGRDLRPPPVKLAAARHRLPLTQPERLNDAVMVDTLRAIAPEVIVVVAFGHFLPRAIREIPPLGCINVHASLLPKYRGAAPIHRAVMAGDDETGVTIMRVEERMDAGPILLQRTCPILPADDTGILHDRLATLGAEALSDALRLLSVGSGAWIPQDETRVSVAPKLGDADCRLELAGPPTTLVNRIRGLSPTPGAYLVMPDGKRLRIFRAEARQASAPRGVILGVEDAAVVLGTGEGAVALLEVQPEGKRRMTGAEFARGQRLQTGMRGG